jgi:hypothetical protein
LLVPKAFSGMRFEDSPALASEVIAAFIQVGRLICLPMSRKPTSTNL